VAERVSAALSCNNNSFRQLYCASPHRDPHRGITCARATLPAVILTLL